MAKNCLPVWNIAWYIPLTWHSTKQYLNWVIHNCRLFAKIANCMFWSRCRLRVKILTCCGNPFVSRRHVLFHIWPTPSWVIFFQLLVNVQCFHLDHTSGENEESTKNVIEISQFSKISKKTKVNDFTSIYESPCSSNSDASFRAVCSLSNTCSSSAAVAWFVCRTMAMIIWLLRTLCSLRICERFTTFAALINLILCGWELKKKHFYSMIHDLDALDEYVQVYSTHFDGGSSNFVATATYSSSATISKRVCMLIVRLPFSFVGTRTFIVAIPEGNSTNFLLLFWTYNLSQMKCRLFVSIYLIRWMCLLTSSCQVLLFAFQQWQLNKPAVTWSMTRTFVLQDPVWWPKLVVDVRINSIL